MLAIRIAAIAGQLEALLRRRCQQEMAFLQELSQETIAITLRTNQP
jgi:hypothetical protein